MNVQRPSGRSFLPDALKAAGCVLIVLHHLAFYGPMSDVVLQSWPRLIEWLHDHGRLAVQVFLVCSGFLTATSLRTQRMLDWRDALRLVWRRYVRLALPLLAALSATVVLTESIRPHFDFPSLSATPDWDSAWAHVFFLQQVLDMESLSAGIWYVAIDFQLYLITLLTLLVVTWVVRRHPGLRASALRWQIWLGLTVVSLVRWNLNADLDHYGVYFFGAYGLGLLAQRARQSRIALKGWAVLLVLGLLALWVDPRWRITTAWGCALLLAAAPERWFSAQGVSRMLRWSVQKLSTVSYSVFLIHYAVSLLVSALVTTWWPEDVLVNALGMALSLVLSVLAGVGLFRMTEEPSRNVRRWAGWVAVFMASVALAMEMASAA
jgi:peptidoglycan/LPS O-acetylase OafA/YrhL